MLFSIYFCQCWVFVAAGAFLCLWVGAALWPWYAGFSMRRLSLLWSSVARACGLPYLQLLGSRAQVQQWGWTGLVVPRHVGSSQARARTCVSCGFLREESWLRWEYSPLEMRGGWSWRAGEEVQEGRTALGRASILPLTTSTAKQFPVTGAVLSIAGCWATSFPAHPESWWTKMSPDIALGAERGNITPVEELLA